MSDEYRKILSRADEFFADVASRLPKQLECRRGCTMCCHGLFEVSSADVSMIIEGLRALDPAVRERIIERAKKIVQELDHPRLRESTPAEREAFFERSSEVPCPALDATGACSIYEHRPIVCRTFGLPVREGGNYLGQ